MDRATIEAMLAEQEANMKRLQENALRVQGAMLVLREMLKKIDAEAEKAAEEAAKKRDAVLPFGETCLAGRGAQWPPLPGETEYATIWVTQERTGERRYEWRGDSTLAAISYEFEPLVAELPWILAEVEKDFPRARTIWRREPED